ncbi:sensor histidine kinase [Kitasatospora sp. NPDC058444]|uniref:sensor histidine kinase n=1 Tax=Kitasatospora sp. NPDC058444 TaxID=3346504 RepID=UPI00366750B9
MTWSWHTVVRRAGYGAAVAGALAAAVAGMGDPGPLIVGSGLVAVVAGLFPVLWVSGRVGAVSPSVLVACAVSLLVTVGYRGPVSGGIESWWLLETVALLAPAVPAVRRLPTAAAVGHGALLVAAVALVPLRIGVWAEPPAPLVVTVKLCLASVLLSCAVVGVGCYLRSMDARARAAVAAERRAQRLDLARDLHDFAAHDVTGVVVLAQAAQVLAQQDPRQVVELLAGIEAAGRQALITMDRTVQVFAADDADPEPRGRLRTPAGRGAGPGAGPGPGRTGGPGARSLRRDLSELPALAERFTRSGSARVRLEAPTEAELAAVPAPISGLGYRLVVEALTNVRRHAPAAREVAIEVGPDRCGERPALRVTVTDDGAPGGAGADGSGGSDGSDGSGASDGSGGGAGAGGGGGALGGAEREGGGFGLVGLRERVEAAGGELTAGPGPEGGWRVAAVLPTDGVAGLGA